MKKIHFILLQGVILLLALYSCEPENSFPTPLTNVTVTDQVFRADETSRNVDVRIRMDDVEAYVMDMETNVTAEWITVRVNGTALNFNLTENISIKDRQAKVELAYVGSRTDLEGPTSLSFIVTQKKNKVFDNLDIEAEIIRDYRKSDTTINTNTTLKNIKVEITDKEGQKQEWCKVKISNENDLLVLVEENKSNSVRQAFVKLAPYSGQVETPDSLVAKKTFVITQLKNPVLDDLDIETVNLNYNDTTFVLKTGRPLTNIRANVIDTLTNENSTWAQVRNISGDSVTIHVSKLAGTVDRTSVVTLYLPNNNYGIDSTTIAYSFSIHQKHNNATDSLKLDARTMEADQTRDTIKVDCSLKGFTSKNIDGATQLTAQWLKVRVEEQQIVLMTDVNNTAADRTAMVTIFQPNNDPLYNDTIQHSFLLTQKAKKRLEPEVYQMETNHTAHTIDIIVTSNVKYQVADDCEWITGYRMTPVDEQHEKLTFDLQENTTTADRTGKITLSSGTLTADITVIQKTNPDILLMNGTTDNMLFNKYYGEFVLNIKTLTPNYKITRTQNWINIGGQETLNEGEYCHKIVVTPFSDDVGERVDTIIVKNFAQESRLIVKQTNYLVMETSWVEIEEGKQVELKCKNASEKTIVWSSINENIATVDQSGVVSALKSGKVNIYASIGKVGDIDDYNVVCAVTVFNASDKMDISLDKSNSSYSRNGDRVTADCPIVIKNNYDGGITINSVKIRDGNGDVIQVCTQEDVVINRDKSATFPITKLVSVYKPYIVVQMTCNGKSYTKTVEYK